MLVLTRSQRNLEDHNTCECFYLLFLLVDWTCALCSTVKFFKFPVMCSAYFSLLLSFDFSSLFVLQLLLFILMYCYHILVLLVRTNFILWSLSKMMCAYCSSSAPCLFLEEYSAGTCARINALNWACYPISNSWYLRRSLLKVQNIGAFFLNTLSHLSRSAASDSCCASNNSLVLCTL